MQPIRLEHFITYTSAPSIDEYLEVYRQAGFRPLDSTVRHEPGLRNGFLGYGPEYIEFCWVEDEDLFAASDPADRVLRDAARPYSIGMVTRDIHALHEEWTASGYEPAPVWSKAPRDDAPGEEPAWSFQEIPAALEPAGAMSFIVTYHRRRMPPQVVIAANTTYAIAGITCVTAEPVARAQAWARLLAPATPIQMDGETSTLAIGPHVAAWMTPAEYERRYGQRWIPAPHRYGEPAALHLLAEDLATAEAVLTAAGRDVRPVTQPAGLFVTPDSRDGFAFLLAERPARDWIAWRNALTGEQLSL